MMGIMKAGGRKEGGGGKRCTSDWDVMEGEKNRTNWTDIDILKCEE